MRTRTSAAIAISVALAIGLVPGAAGASPGVTVTRLPSNPSLGHPFFSTTDDLAGAGYVEEEFVVAGAADGYDTTGNQVAADVPYRTRVVVRRPASKHRFNGTALVEWQNVTAGYDLDALWDGDAVTRAGSAWIGVSAQRVGVEQLRGWNPARYGTLDVTGGGRFTADELSYDIFAQAAAALTDRSARTVLAIGASQSASRLTVYHQHILPKVTPVFDGYAFVVGPAPTRAGAEPVLQILSETDVFLFPSQAADTDRFRRWEVAGAAHSGWRGQQYRAPISVRDLGAAPQYTCDKPPFSRVPLDHVVAAGYDHLVRWVRHGVQPPAAPRLQLVRDDLGHMLGGIRLSQVAAPTARNTGVNTGQTFCRLFGTHEPLDEATLRRLYPHRGAHLWQVLHADLGNIRAGYLLPADAAQNLREALAGTVSQGIG